jgi:hypothetical protein
MRKLSRVATLTLSFATVVLAFGCGPDGPPIYNVSGTIKYDGKPVPKGIISFDPDSSKGTAGKMGYAEILNGQFDTKTGGFGVRGGAYLIRISAFDGDKNVYESPNGRSLCPEYTSTKELAKQDSTLEIAIPKGGK